MGEKTGTGDRKNLLIAIPLLNELFQPETIILVEQVRFYKAGFFFFLILFSFLFYFLFFLNSEFSETGYVTCQGFTVVSNPQPVRVTYPEKNQRENKKK